MAASSSSAVWPGRAVADDLEHRAQATATAGTPTRPARSACRRRASCRAGSTCRRRGSLAATSASASPGLKIGGVSHAMYTRGSSHAVLDDDAALGRDRRRLHRDLRHVRPALERAEVLLDQRLRLRLVDVADDREARVVRRVVLLEELLHVVELRRLDVGVRSDHVGVVRMALRKQHVVHAPRRRCRTAAFSTLCRRSLRTTSCWFASFGLVERRRADSPCDRTRATAPSSSWFDGQRLEVVRPIEVGRAVQMSLPPAASSNLKCESPGTCFEPWNIMCSKRCAKPVRPGRFVGRADVVPEFDGDERQPVVLRQDDLEAVRQRVLLEREAWCVRGSSTMRSSSWPARMSDHKRQGSAPAARASAICVDGSSKAPELLLRPRHASDHHGRDEILDVLFLQRALLLDLLARHRVRTGRARTRPRPARRRIACPRSRARAGHRAG